MVRDAAHRPIEGSRERSVVQLLPIGADEGELVVSPRAVLLHAGYSCTVRQEKPPAAGAGAAEFCPPGSVTTVRPADPILRADERQTYPLVGPLRGGQRLCPFLHPVRSFEWAHHLEAVDYISDDDDARPLLLVEA